MCCIVLGPPPRPRPRPRPQVVSPPVLPARPTLGRRGQLCCYAAISKVIYQNDLLVCFLCYWLTEEH